MMAGAVTVFCFILLVSATYAIIAVTDTVLQDISNDISNDTKISNETQTDSNNSTGSNLLAISHIELNNSTNTTQPRDSLSEVNGTKICTHNNTNNTLNDLNNLEEPKNFRCDQGKNNDEALILTPFLEEGRIEEARRASEVNPEVFLGVKSYSGFFTVNETYNSNIFFWYFPVEKKLVNDTPWILWLQGGPGASSMIGVFDEIGPFKVNAKMKLVLNPYTWLRNHSLVFIENPVGTGFSFTNHKDGFVTDMNTYTGHLYSTLRQLVQVFPELSIAPLFLAGESYAGKYVPALGWHIHKHKEDNLVNLQGLMLGNGYVEPAQVFNITRSFYEFGMLVGEQVAIVQPLADAFREDITANRSATAKEKFNSLIALMLLLSNQKQAYNFLADDLAVGKYEPFLDRERVRHALHVGRITHDFVNITVNQRLGPDFLVSTRPMIEQLLNTYNVLVYCGQLDQMLPCAASSEQYRLWRWEYSKEFNAAARSPFVLKNKFVGYFKSGGHLTEVLVRDAGHMVATDQPHTAQELIALWTHNRTLAAVRPMNLTDISDLVRALSWKSDPAFL